MSIWRRAIEILDCSEFRDAQLVISHASTNSSADTWFRRRLEKECAAKRLVYVWTMRDSNRLRLGDMRNRGAEAADGEYLLFWDADLAVFPGFLEQLSAFLDDKPPGDFAIIPSLYSSRAGSRLLAVGAQYDLQAARSAYWMHRRDLISHLALNTSTIALRREHFVSLGGFDPEYRDHGLEDFDFVLRLSLARTQIAVPTDLTSDVPTTAPAFSTGFRSYLNILSLPVFLRGLCTFHRWHPHPGAKPYYQHRDQNAALFRTKIEAEVQRSLNRGDPLEWKAFLREDGTFDSLRLVTSLVEQSGGSVQECSALYDNVPNHLFHTNRTWRRLKKGWRNMLWDLDG